MKVANNKEEVLQAYRLARAEARANFGHDEVYMERYLSVPRHIEFQMLADAKGHVVCLGERDCSLQRNHQKVWEESPAPLLSEKLADKMRNLLIKALKKLKYVGVGTIEMLLEDGKFYFMEMNTRLQVEHTITEMVFGIDLVREQIRAAAGFPLSMTQKDIVSGGMPSSVGLTLRILLRFFPRLGRF